MPTDPTSAELKWSDSTSTIQSFPNATIAGVEKPQFPAFLVYKDANGDWQWSTLDVVLAAIRDRLPAALDVDTGGLKVDVQNAITAAISGTVAVSATSLPLPSGAATSALQSTANTALDAIKTAVEGTLTVSTGLTQPTTPSDTQPVSAASLPLPTGASTAANQSTAITHLAAIETAVEGTLAVSAATLPLPSGAATSANQATAITHLAAIETAVEGTLNVADAGGSLTVDGTVAVSSVAGSVAVTDDGGSLTVDGSVSASNFPATVDTNTGGVSASTPRVVVATDQTPYRVKQPNQTYSAPSQVSVTNASTALCTAIGGGGASVRFVRVKVPASADTGVFIAVNATATSSHWLMSPGEVRIFVTHQAINAIRAGATNVTVYVEESTA